MAPAIEHDVTILFGSQTGNAQHLAADMKKRLEEKGFAVTLSCMSDFRTNNLKKVKQLLIVVSTYGEGDPPDKAVLFHEFVHGKRAPRLEGMRFSVLSLGDQLYDQFCKTGKDFDARLEELGATRIHARVDCDVDFDEPAKAWMDGVIEALSGRPRPRLLGGRDGDLDDRLAAAAPAELLAGISAAGHEPPPRRHRRPGLYPHEPLHCRSPGEHQSQWPRLRQGNPPPEAGPGRFRPASSRAIRWASIRTTIRNGRRRDRPDGVESRRDGCRRQAGTAAPRGADPPLRDHAVEQAVAQTDGRLLEDGLQDIVQADANEKLKAYTRGRDLLDLVRDFSIKDVPAREFVPMLRKLPARLYSIASSRGRTRTKSISSSPPCYQAHNRDRLGPAPSTAPSGLSPATRFRSSSIRTRISACPPIRTCP